MAVTETQIFNAANNLLNFSDTVAITDNKKTDIINRAVFEYSSARPQTSIQEFTGTDESFYDVPADFDIGFSEIIEIELPKKKPDGSIIPRNPKVVIDPRIYTVDLLPSGSNVIRFDSQSLFGPFQVSSGDPFWVRYTTRYFVDSGGLTTIPDYALTALSYIAASLWSLVLASHFAGKADASLSEVEIVGFPVRPKEWRKQAEEWRKEFDKLTADQGLSGINANLDFTNFKYWNRDNQ
ncbi:hypothetical protein LCGC14_2212250 [marine sediment metagenome]|uniref:Uncharacterized protein n=1 Tax=marine sediment metagenome TaxID=412755 RepID=A0A0F9FR02_9ZZZZ